MEKNQYVRITNPAPLEGAVCVSQSTRRGCFFLPLLPPDCRRGAHLLSFASAVLERGHTLFLCL